MICTKAEWDISQAYVPYGKTNAELTSDTSTLFTENTRQETEIGVVANAGAKNILMITAPSGVLNTATVDIANDGSIHITGQPTSNGTYVLSSGIELTIPENTYILSSGSEAGNTKLTLSLRHKGTTQYVDLYMAESRIIPAGTYDRLHVYLYANIVYDTHIYPMIRPASITDSTFQPYALPNPTLTPAVIKAVDEGSKNRFDINATPTVNHTTYSLTDGVLIVTSNGIWANYNVPVYLPAGDYVFSAAISNFSRASGAAEGTVRFRIAENTSGGTEIAGKTITGNGKVKIPFSWTGGMFYVQYYSNYSATSTYVSTFTASDSMICTAADWAVSQKFVPYAPTNRELYETGQPSYDFIFGLGTALQSGDDLNNYNKVGKIYAATGAIAATILNTPWMLSGFTVFTIPFLTTVTYMQFLLPNTVTGKWYRRRYTQGAWSAWIEYDETDINGLLSDIDNSTTITAYVDRLAKGHYTSFVANMDRPSDAPIADNMFIEIYIYSANTALIRAFPTGSVYGNQIYQKSKVSGVWKNWIKFEGTEVT